MKKTAKALFVYLMSACIIMLCFMTSCDGSGSSAAIVGIRPDDEPTAEFSENQKISSIQYRKMRSDMDDDKYVGLYLNGDGILTVVADDVEAAKAETKKVTDAFLAEAEKSSGGEKDKDAMLKAAEQEIYFKASNDVQEYLLAIQDTLEDYMQELSINGLGINPPKKKVVINALKINIGLKSKVKKIIGNDRYLEFEKGGAIVLTA